MKEGKEITRSFSTVAGVYRSDLREGSVFAARESLFIEIPASDSLVLNVMSLFVAYALYVRMWCYERE